MMQSGLQHSEFRERTKLDSKHIEGDEEHLSQPSTMHSLGNLEEHSPKASTRANSYEPGHQIKQEIKSQAQNIKAMIKHVFGEKVDTSKDNDQTTKQAVRKVNEEIRKLPKRQERVIESAGKGASQEAESKGPEVKNRPQYYASSGLDDKIKNQLTKLNNDIKQLPRKGERVLQTQGQAREEKSGTESYQSRETSYSQSSQNQQGSTEKDLWEIAFHKIEEMKEKAHQKGQEFKQEAEKLSHRTHGAEVPHESHEHHEHHHLSAESPSFQPTEHSKILADTVKEGLKDPSVHLTEKVEEFENHWREDHPNQPQRNQQQGYSEQRQQQPQERPQIREQGQFQTREAEQPASLKQGAQELKEKISEKADEIKENIQSRQEGQQSQHSGNKEQIQPEKSESEQPKAREPLLDKIMNRFHAVSDNIHHTIEEIQSALRVEERPVEPSGQQKEAQSQDQPPSENKEVSQKEGKKQQKEPFLDKIVNRIHVASDNIGHTIEDLRDTFKVGERPAGPGESGGEREQIIERQEVQESPNPGESQKPVNIQGQNEEQNQGQEQEIQPHEEGYHLKEKIMDGIHNISSAISYNIETVKNKFIHSKPEEQNREAQEENQNIDLHNEGHSIKDRIIEGIHNISDKIHHGVESVRGRFSSAKKRLSREGQEESEGFHKVKTGFSETVQEYIHETKWTPPAKSRNPFELLEDENDVFEEEDNDEQGREAQGKSFPQRIKESFARGLEGVKNKFASKEKGAIEEIHEVVQENEQEGQPSKGRIRKGLEDISNKISQNIENVKRKLSGNKLGLQKERSVKEQMWEGVDSLEVENADDNENLPSISKSQKKKARALKSASKANPRENIKQKIPKARKISLEGFHDITSGFSETVAEHEKEIRGAPLVSNNPFAGLEAGRLGAGSQKPYRKRKISFQQEVQGARKRQLRATQSARKAKEIEMSFEDFHGISSGFSETVGHYQKELRGEPLISSNPFGSLSEKTEQQAAPSAQKIGQKAKKIAKKVKKAFGTDITNKIVGGSDEKEQSKSLIQKAKQGIHDSSSKISGKLHEAKGKVKKALHMEDKENVDQGLIIAGHW